MIVADPSKGGDWCCARDSPEEIHETRSVPQEPLTKVTVQLCYDMFGGTPSNISLTFLGETVDVVRG